MSQPRFYPIFEDSKWLERMLPLGVRLVQLRIKNRSAGEVRREIEQSRDLCAAHGAQLVVNDYWREAIDLGCDFVHLGQEDLEQADLAALRRAGIRLGISTHDEAELERALAWAPAYVALGPIYPTRLKRMKWHRQGLGRLAEWRRLVGGLPLVAIGGMRPDRAAAVFAAGADMISVVTDITLDPDPEARIQDWLRVVTLHEEQKIEQP